MRYVKEEHKSNFDQAQRSINKTWKKDPETERKERKKTKKNIHTKKATPKNRNEQKEQ